MNRLLAWLTIAAASVALNAQPRITSPKEDLGFNFGDDYFLANYKQIAAYWQKLDAESDRHGRPGHRQDRRRPAAVDGDRHVAGEPPEAGALQGHLAAARAGRRADRRRRRARSRRKARRSSGSTAACTRPRRSARSSSARCVYQMVSRTDEETMRFLNDCIILFVHANPDGNDLVADWYMRNPDPEQAHAERPAAALPEVHRPRQQPRLLRVDAGGDARTSTACSTTSGSRRSSTTITRAARRARSPGRRRCAIRTTTTSIRSLILGLQALGTHMHQRLAAEGKPGATMASGGAYDGWWNGGIRNTGDLPQHHRHPDRDDRQPDADARFRSCSQRQIPNRDLPYPIAPQEWHFRQSIDYSMSFNRGGPRLRVAQPREPALQHLPDGAALDRARQPGLRGRRRRRASRRSPSRSGGAGRSPPAALTRRAAPGPRCASRSCATRAATSSRPIQPDFPTATKFVNALLESRASTVHRATRDFDVAGKTLSGGLVRRDDRAGVPAARDRHVRAAGSSRTSFPIPARRRRRRTTTPAGRWRSRWACSSIASSTGSPARSSRSPTGTSLPPPGRVLTADGTTTAFAITREANDAFRAVNRLLASGEPVRSGESFYVGASDATAERIRRLATELGVTFKAVTSVPDTATAVRPAQHRPVGSVRRLDRLRLDALDPRAVRVPVRARLRAASSTPATSTRSTTC